MTTLNKYKIDFNKTDFDIEVFINGQFVFVIDDVFFDMKTLEDYYYYLKHCISVHIQDIKI